MPLSASDAASVVAPNCGWRREPGQLRTSATSLIRASASAATNAAPKSELLNVPGERSGDVGAVVCFVVAPDQRRLGIATTLLDAALDHLRQRGLRAVEAYPWLGEVEPARWVWTQYVGPLSMYAKAGFAVAETRGDFCIVRREL